MLVLAAALLFASGGFLLKLASWHPMSVSAGRASVAAVEASPAVASVAAEEVRGKPL